MASLSTEQRTEAARGFARRMFRDLRQTANFGHDELERAVAAADEWVENNALLYNAALPLPFRSDASSVQKAALLAFVVMTRAGLL